jgi:DNA-binding NtrC family response regulator
MPASTVIIVQHDPLIAEELANDLHAHFARVAVAGSASELRTLLPRHEARVAVLDTEIVNLEEIGQLVGNFRDLVVVATHRSPDERMWMAALNAGAVEFCHPQDLRSILRASRVATKRRMSVAA